MLILQISQKIGVVLVNRFMWVCISKYMILFRWLPKEIVTNLIKNLEIQEAFSNTLLLRKENFIS